MSKEEIIKKIKILIDESKDKSAIEQLFIETHELKPLYIALGKLTYEREGLQ